ncbi:5,10-methylenetetrahydrofolate reductase [Candidatus Bathyarchaeota archaeon]|nr:MAG: 5,10-methylenetetrahydrofolate reductase [Candidatus Bathyarchaeota archaeon]
MAEERIFSNLMRELKAGKFVFTGELEPGKEGSIETTIEAARKLLGQVTACNVTDNPQSFGCVNSLAAAFVVQKETGMECICQLRCSDKNRLALLSDVLAAGLLGIKNILAITGDYVSLGDTPDVKPVYDLDSTLLTRMIRMIVDEGKDFRGNEIRNPPKLHVGVAANPGSEFLDMEVYKLKRKVKAGAEFVQTQVVFLPEVVDRFFAKVKEVGGIDIPILIGIFPAKSYAEAKFFHEQVSGVIVPEDYMAKLKETKEIKDKEKRKERIDQINIEYFTGFLEHLKSTPAAGCHIMAVGYPEIIPELRKVVA